MKKIFFKDQGQDFLVWTIDADGLITNCSPAQSWLWNGCTVTNHATIKRNDRAEVVLGSGKVMTVKYLIEKVENL